MDSRWRNSTLMWRAMFQMENKTQGTQKKTKHCWTQDMWLLSMHCSFKKQEFGANATCHELKCHGLAPVLAGGEGPVYAPVSFKSKYGGRYSQFKISNFNWEKHFWYCGANKDRKGRVSSLSDTPIVIRVAGALHSVPSGQNEDCFRQRSQKILDL